MFFPKFRKSMKDLEIIYHDGLFYWGNNKIIENNINTFSKYFKFLLYS